MLINMYFTMGSRFSLTAPRLQPEINPTFEMMEDGLGQCVIFPAKHNPAEVAVL